MTQHYREWFVARPGEPINFIDRLSLAQSNLEVAIISALIISPSPVAELINKASWKPERNFYAKEFWAKMLQKTADLKLADDLEKTSILVAIMWECGFLKEYVYALDTFELRPGRGAEFYARQALLGIWDIRRTLKTSERVTKIITGGSLWA
jgi:hypothetical protein